MEYSVTFSKLIRERLRAIQQEAESAGLGELVQKAIQNLLDRVRKTPFEVGEAMYHLSFKGWPVHTAVERPISIVFTICEEEHLVWIVSVNRLF